MNNVKGILFTTWIFVSVYKTRGDEIINMNGAFISSTGQVYANMAASRAIDGIANTSAETCRCCTVIQRPAQIVLNLTRPYWVSRIEVLGRTDSGSDQNFNIQLETALQLEDFTSQILKNGRYPSTIAEFNPPQLAQLIRINGTGANDTYMAVCEITVYQNANAQHQTTFLQAFIRLTRDSTAVPVNNASSTFGLALLFTPLILARYVKIQQQDAINMYMALCEVEIFAGECPPGRFGDRCDRYCHCSGNCDSITGECAQCLPGWKPGTCSAQCDNGYFGQNCSSICHCRNISTCHRESGQCSDGNCASGWIGSNCSATCKDGFFGVNCSSPCHCQPDVTCTHTNGQCANMQCAAGWTGENCSAECEHDYFGINCSSRCHCREDATCDHIYGNCSDNQCGDGYTGDNCSEECEAGKFGVGCASQCHCQNNPTCNHVNGGCNDFVCAAGWASDNCSIACKDGFFGINCTSLCHCHPGVKCNHTNGQCANMQCAAGWTGENCSAECEHDYFGMNCSSRCHCREGATCDHINGNCSDNRCGDGYTGDNCSKECETGTFGVGCASQCHCQNSPTCNHVNGICYDFVCAAGWTSGNCSIACKDGFFGMNCTSPCHCQPDVKCKHTNGQCTNMQCAAGWTGENCSAECEHDFFGMNCSSRCHCREGATCDHINGNCSDNRCGDGYTGDNCSKECEAGKFGVGCTSQCHCQNSPTCNHVNGSCYDFVCAAGWTSDNCSIACTDGFFGMNCTSPCHCQPDVKCKHTNGQCANMQCAAGWTGENCSAECEHDYFGMNCSSRCHCRVVATCDHINGNCSDNRCGDGYTGDNCSKECEADKFGVGCASQCHCQNSPTCNHVNGSCYDFVCAAGWASGNCSIECLPGTYGKNCSSDCNCEGCNHVTGSCALAKSCFTGFTIRSSDAICTKCNRGLYGDNCSMECHCDNCHNINGSCALLSKRCHDGFHFENGLCKADDLKSTQAAAIGGGVGAAVSAIVVAAVVVIVIRKRHVFKKEAQLHNDTEMTDISKTLRSSIGQDNNAFSDVGNKAFENLDSDYYSFKSVAPGIKIHLLWDNIREKRKYGSSYFSDEFAKLPTGLIHKHDVASSPENSGKNRYREMFAYDHSRVPLKKEKPSDSDYINACYIHGFEKVNKFIASQGPTEKMIVDFWRMIWQQRVEKIIMLTNLMELGTLKCLQYWPEEIGSVSTFGDVNVKFIGIEETYDFNIRTLNIHKGQEKRHVKQFHFKSWPDKDVPDTTWCLLDFWRAVDTNDSTNTSPIVVHCSAGVGRTGTFIALDTLINLGRMEGYVTPFPMVEALRQQRVNMVQTKDQYVYMHEALADAFLMGTHHVLTRQFENVFKYMIGNEKGSNITRVDKQFDLIVRSVEDSSREVNAFAHASCEPIYGNLDNAISEIDAYRPQLLKRGSNYIQQLGVEFIPAFGSTNALLVCMSPTDQHLEEFWSLAEEHHVTTMINLSAPGSAAYETCKFLGGRGSGRVGKFAVKYIQEKKNNGIVERSFSCRDDNHEGENNLTTIKQFHLTSWLEGSDTPPDMQSFLDLIAKALDSQPQLSDSKPILIHCQTGFIRCGLTALVMNEMVRIRKENGQINIVESAKTMKTKFRDLVQSKAQYRFCYEAILSYIKNAETYQNL
ncbi:uncharacterized protein LOC127851914 isoform X3 [Dreissena polymorpha]|uniref:uncharacterized protein LOC127851914 isoform X3 n=1 Tax=Dreissena polymorpha TaxID=45954 RepID=UPI002263E9C2|nr:uncharacterized protein LOC127851914 isoform X3 [Dreissena polymorpha]